MVRVSSKMSIKGQSYHLFGKTSDIGTHKENMADVSAKSLKARSEDSFWEKRAAAQEKILEENNEDVRERKRVSLELLKEQSENDAANGKMNIASLAKKDFSSVQASYDKNSVFLGGSSKTSPILVTSKKLMPDGTILVTTKKDGKIVEQHKKKPHMIPVHDPTTQKVEMEPVQNIFEML